MIQIRGLVKSFGAKKVLDGVDLDVRRGETVVVLGPSGTGKSVLLKHVLGLIHPDAGSIVVDGVEVVGMAEDELDGLRQRFGMLFQGAALFDSLTVAGNVALPLRVHTKMREREIMERVRERLEWVGLHNVEHMKPASLSGGMRKRVGLARAIVMDPAIILYDEPTTGLDPVMADVIDNLIRGMQKRLNGTSIVVTHDLKSAFSVGDRLAMLVGGKIIFEGTAEEVRTTRHPIVRQFIEGSSEGPLQPV
jgi:phospholipid/cholesterol/gamma-HCH transport system ATP-binding protein